MSYALEITLNAAILEKEGIGPVEVRERDVPRLGEKQPVRRESIFRVNRGEDAMNAPMSLSDKVRRASTCFAKFVSRRREEKAIGSRHWDRRIRHSDG